jgi:ABC-type glycerol-3-phosphate transport system substrate-binding protein
LVIVICCVCGTVISCGKQHRDHGLVIMLPPWFSPDEAHPPVKRVFDRFRDMEELEPLLRVSPGKSILLWRKILMMAKERHLPDVMMFKTSWTMDLANRSILQPIPAPLAEEIIAHSNPALIDIAIRDGIVWSVPYDMDVRLIHYRTDLAEKTGLPLPTVGWTYEQFIALAAALTKDTNLDGRIDVWGFATPGARSLSSVAQLLPWAWMVGADVSAREGWPLAEEPLAEALGLYAELRDSLGICPPDLHVLEQLDVYHGLTSGRFAMTEGGSWEIKMMEQGSSFPQFIAQAPLPSWRGGEPVTATDGWAFGVATTDPVRQQAAGRLLKELFSVSHQKEKLAELGWLPVRSEGIDWVRTEMGSAVAWSLERCRSVPGGVDWPRVALAIADALQDVLAGGHTPLHALQSAQRRLEGMEQ